MFKVCSELLAEGLAHANIKVLQFPTKLSFKTCVSLEPRKGVWRLLRSRARMHSFSANNDLFISAPSIYVCLSTQSIVSAPRSEPARSMNDIFPCSFLEESSYKLIYKIAWLRLESSLAPVEPMVRTLFPKSMICINCYTFAIFFSESPQIFTFYLASSRANTCCRSFSKSWSFPQ